MYVDGVCDFFSSYISGAQRIKGWTLENNGYFYTLITEGMKGRLFIVKTSVIIENNEFCLRNKVIWEFINPEIAKGEGKDVILGRSSIFRSRYMFPNYFTKEQLIQILIRRKKNHMVKESLKEREHLWI